MQFLAKNTKLKYVFKMIAETKQVRVVHVERQSIKIMYLIYLQISVQTLNMGMEWNELTDEHMCKQQNWISTESRILNPNISSLLNCLYFRNVRFRIIFLIYFSSNWYISAHSRTAELLMPLSFHYICEFKKLIALFPRNSWNFMAWSYGHTVFGIF